MMKLIIIVFFLSIIPITHADKINNLVDLNAASVKELEHILKGIGINKARAIVEYRKTHGPFVEIEELSSVKGFSKKYVKNNLEKLQKIFFLQKQDKFKPR